MTVQPIYTRATKTIINGPAGRQFVMVEEDSQAQQVAALVAQGVDQVTASGWVYCNTPPVWDAPRPVWSVWIRRHVASLFAPLWDLVDRIDTRYANALNPPEEQ